MTTDLNIEMYRALAKIAGDENLMQQAVDFVKSLVKKAKKPDPTLMTKEEFFAKLEQGEDEFRQGKCVRLQPGESLSDMLRRSGL